MESPGIHRAKVPQNLKMAQVPFSWSGQVAIVCVVTASLVAAQPPANFEEISARATTAREQGNLPLAIQFYNQALELNSKWAEGWWFLGSLQYGSESFAPARDALSRYLELTPNAPPALALRGLCEFETGEYPAALEYI